MVDEYGVLERALKVIQMSKVAWLTPRVFIDTQQRLLEISIHIGVTSDFRSSAKVRIHPLVLRHTGSLPMWEDSAVSNEVLVDQLEKAIINLGMGVLLKEAPGEGGEVYSHHSLKQVCECATPDQSSTVEGADDRLYVFLRWAFFSGLCLIPILGIITIFRSGC